MHSWDSLPVMFLLKFWKYRANQEPSRPYQCWLRMESGCSAYAILDVSWNMQKLVMAEVAVKSSKMQHMPVAVTVVFYEGAIRKRFMLVFSMTWALTRTDSVKVLLLWPLCTSHDTDAGKFQRLTTMCVWLTGDAILIFFEIWKQRNTNSIFPSFRTSNLCHYIDIDSGKNYRFNRDECPFECVQEADMEAQT